MIAVIVDYLKLRKLKEQKEKEIEIEDKLSKRVVQTKLVPKRICLNLFGYFFTQDKSWIDVYVLNHESIHTAQQRELLYIPFYIIYLIEWVIRYFQYKDWKKAYYNISFEKEAYTWGNELWYLDDRIHYSQWKSLYSSEKCLKEEFLKENDNTEITVEEAI